MFCTFSFTPMSKCTKRLSNANNTEQGGSYFPYILLNEIQTMFSQLAKRSARVLPADLCTDHAHYVKIRRLTVLGRNKNMALISLLYFGNSQIY